MHILWTPLQRGRLLKLRDAALSLGCLTLAIGQVPIHGRGIHARNSPCVLPCFVCT